MLEFDDLPEMSPTQFLSFCGFTVFARRTPSRALVAFYRFFKFLWARDFLIKYPHLLHGRLAYFHLKCDAFGAYVVDFSSDTYLDHLLRYLYRLIRHPHAVTLSI